MVERRKTREATKWSFQGRFGVERGRVTKIRFVIQWIFERHRFQTRMRTPGDEREEWEKKFVFIVSDYSAS